MIDLKLTDNGELVIGPDGDLAIVSGDDQVAQEVLFRLKTQLGDWVLSPQIGADLEVFIGEPNTPFIHTAIEQRIVAALSVDNLLFLPEVTATAISENEILVIVEFGSVEDSRKIIQIVSRLDLREGLVFARTTSRLN